MVLHLQKLFQALVFLKYFTSFKVAFRVQILERYTLKIKLEF